MHLYFDNPLFFMNVFSGLVFIIAGYIMLKFPPKRINSFYGYRTNLSMKNQLHWDFAQKYSAITMIKLGFLMTISAGFFLFFYIDETTGIIFSLVCILLLSGFLIWRVEKALKEKFKNEPE